MQKRNKWIFVSLGIAGLLIILLFILFRFATPFGAIVKYQFNSIINSDKVSKLKGAEETSSFNPSENGVLQIPQQTIKQNTVTFNLKLITKPIEGVWVNLRFKGNPKEIRIGVRGSEKEKYQYLPLYYHILNSLSWNKTLDGNTTLWQREKKYKDISELANKLPIEDQVKVASYFFNPSDIAMKENNSSAQNNIKIEKKLRGTHNLWFIVDKQPFLLTVFKQDANSYKGEDVLSMQIFNGQNKIAEQLILDDGVTDNGGLMMTPQKGEIKINDIKPGVYRIVLKDMTENADVQIKSIEVNQPSFVFQSPVFVVDEKTTTLWTNTKQLKLITNHNIGIQTVKLDSKYDLKIDKTNENYEFNLNKPEDTDNNKELHQLEIPKNDLIINGDGYFAFTKESFFNPEPIKMVDLSKITDMEKIDYIIANYQQAKKDGEWYSALAYFDPKDIVIDGDKLYFSLESPELSSYGGEIIVDNLEITVKKPGWFTSTGGQKTGGTVNTTQKTEANTNIFSRFINWINTKIDVMKKSISNTFSKSAPSPIITSKPSPIATQKPTPTSTSTPYANILIRVLNGGAESGTAGTIATILKDNGFTNVKAENADNSEYKNVTINYRKDDIKIVEKIEGLLKNKYGTIIKTPSTSSINEVVIILGKK